MPEELSKNMFHSYALDIQPYGSNNSANHRKRNPKMAEVEYVFDGMKNIREQIARH